MIAQNRKSRIIASVLVAISRQVRQIVQGSDECNSFVSSSSVWTGGRAEEALHGDD